MVLAMVYRLYTIGTCLEVKACGRNKYLRGRTVVREFTLKQASKHYKAPKHSALVTRRGPLQPSTKRQHTILGQTLTKLAVVAE